MGIRTILKEYKECKKLERMDDSKKSIKQLNREIYLINKQTKHAQYFIYFLIALNITILVLRIIKFFGRI